MPAEYDNALIYLNKATTIDPNNSKAYHSRGNVKVELKDYSGALSDLNIAIKLDKENILAYRDREVLKTIINDYDEAINDFSMFVEKLQKEELTAPFYFKRGKLKFAIKDFQGAKLKKIFYKKMNQENINDILFHLELEGTYFYQDEDNKDGYFIAYRLIVIASDQDQEDFEFEIHNCLKSELSDDNLIFTYVGPDSETHRIIGVPEIEYCEFENSVGMLLEDTIIVDAIEFLKNMKTIEFKDLISRNLHNKKNFKSVI